MFQGGIERADERQRRLRGALRMQRPIAIDLCAQTLITAGFWLAGLVPFWVLASYAAFNVLRVAASYAMLSRGWTAGLRDPSLHVPQQLGSICGALFLALAAPQIGVQPLALLFLIVAFEFSAPDRLSSTIVFGAATAGLGTAILLRGSGFAMPTSTLAGQLMTVVVVFVTMARSVQLAKYVSDLRTSVNRKNAALQEALKKIEQLANRDELTGLENRRSIMRWLGEQMAFSDRTGLPLCIALIDLDHFKRINDTLGHASGDRVLRMFAERACASLRATDGIGRYGGEEFVAVLPATTAHEAEWALERLREAINGSDWPAIGPGLRVTATIGAAVYRPGETAEDLLQRADAALYRGKEAGRNRVVLDGAGRAWPVEMERRIAVAG